MWPIRIAWQHQFRCKLSTNSIHTVIEMDSHRKTWSSCRSVSFRNGFRSKGAPQSIAFAFTWLAAESGRSLGRHYSKPNRVTQTKPSLGSLFQRIAWMCWNCLPWLRWPDTRTVLWWHLAVVKTISWLWSAPKTLFHIRIRNCCLPWANRKFSKSRCSLLITWMRWDTRVLAHHKWTRSHATAATVALGNWNWLIEFTHVCASCEISNVNWIFDWFIDYIDHVHSHRLAPPRTIPSIPMECTPRIRTHWIRHTEPVRWAVTARIAVPATSSRIF